MDAIVKFLEKHQALFDKISRNIYLVAIKDGFLSNMPIVLFSSLFLLLSTLPAYVGIALPSEVLDFFNKIYAYTMGLLGIMVAGTTASSLAKSMTAACLRANLSTPPRAWFVPCAACSCYR